jgi:hypothetical protein
MAQNLRQWADATAAFGSEGMKAAATKAPMFAHATEALMLSEQSLKGIGVTARLRSAGSTERDIAADLDAR